MTKDELIELLRLEDDFLKFKDAKDAPSTRPDLAALIVLDRLVPGTQAIVSAAEHDEIFLDIDLDKLAEVITEDTVKFLRQCGIRADYCGSGLAMFI